MQRFTRAASEKRGPRDQGTGSGTRRGACWLHEGRGGAGVGKQHPQGSLLAAPQLRISSTSWGTLSGQVEASPL